MTTMQRMEPQHAQIKPPPGSVADGVTPDGRQIYRMETKRARAVPRLDKNGERMYRRNQATGEPMYPLNRPEVTDRLERFTLESEGNWNVRKIPYVPPTEEQLREQERQRQVAQMSEALPRMLVDEGFTADELLAALRAGRGRGETAPSVVTLPEPNTDVSSVAAQAPPAAPTGKSGKPLSAYPINYAHSMWEFSDGSKQRIAKDRALEYEAELQERARQAAEDAAGTPEV